MIFDPNDEPTADADIAAMKQANRARIDALAARGIQINQQGRVPAVLEFLLDELIGATDARIEFERKWEQNLSDDLDKIDQQLRAQMLTQGVQADPRVVRQLHHNGAR